MTSRTPTSERLARLIGTTLIVLGVLAYFFFPATAAAGTETAPSRTITALSLVAAGALLHLGRGRLLVSAAAALLLACAAVVAHAAWLAAPAAVVFIEALSGWVFTRIAPPKADAAVPDAEHESESATEIIESIATAFILALIVREFAFEAFKIPTGSMQPTIWGDDYGRRKGDRLLAAKGPLYFGEPQRWSIMVFKYPLFRQTNYIKRLIGLPGETLSIRRGDIYADGKVVAKPEAVQETLWFPVFPDAQRTWRGPASQQLVSDGAGKWTYDAADAATGTADARKTAWTILDSGCPDVRVSFDLDASALWTQTDTTPDAGSALVRLDGGGRRVEFEARRDGIFLTAPGVAQQKLDTPGIGTGTERLGFAVADRMVRVYRGGRLVARIATADEENASGGRQEQVWFGVSGGTAKFTKIAVERDLQYGDASPSEWKIPADCYFMLGDNTSASRDSRLWRGNVFRTKAGAEYVADDNVRLDDEHQVQNIKNLGDAYEFFDSYGVKRHIAKADLVGESYGSELLPFVRREDLVGRAFLIFFPFPPIGEWRPRILP